ncbi:hypothetical protein MTO96_044849 [Rhipicephalus appendiculatus]
MRRHYLALISEVIFVVATFVLFLQLDRVDLKTVRKLNASVLEDVEREPVDWSELDMSKVFVVYGPSDNKTDHFIKKLLGHSDDSVPYSSFYDDDSDVPPLPDPSHYDDADKNPSSSE